MVIETGSQAEWAKHKGNVEDRKEKLQGKVDKISQRAEKKGWTGQKLSQKLSNLSDRISSLEKSLDNMNTIEASAQVFSLAKSTDDKGGVTFDPNTGNVVIAFNGTASFVHETKHAGQFLAGEVAFSSDGSTMGQDLWDEAAAYQAQFAYSPSSVSRLSSSHVANSFSSITPNWVKNITAKDGKIYGPGGDANTGQSPIDIMSTRALLMKAYPNKAADLLGPRSERLKDFNRVRIAPFDLDGY